MKFLLDTHTFLWFLDDSPQLAPHSRQLIEDEKNDIHLSTASLWEMAIKVSLNKLQLHGAFNVFVDRQIARTVFSCSQFRSAISAWWPHCPFTTGTHLIVCWQRNP